MSNINDYLIWRGDICIGKSYPFNEIDSIILARFSYLRLDKIKLGKEETIESVSNKMKNLKDEEFLYNGDKDLIINLGKSQRFKDMKITDYIKTSEKETEKQFGAVTIHVSSKEMYVSFIGTDSTINGWKEDCNMAFMDNVPCQIEGKKYLERISHEYLNKKIRVGGHSQGGNVAVYAAMTVSKNISKRIIKVYNYDGPGFSKKIIDKYRDDELIKKIESYIPQDSIIGRMLEHEEKCNIVLSIEKGIYEHDIYSWQVVKDEIIKASKLSDKSDIINKTLNDWLTNTTNEQRRIFFDGIFEIINSTLANTFSEISKDLPNSLITIFKAYNGISKEDKKTITSMIKTFVKSYLKEFKNTETIKINKTKGKFKVQSEAL